MPTSLTLQHLSERLFIQQSTDLESLDALLESKEAAKEPLAAYIGFDCTAPSLHVGSLIQIMALRWLAKCGHKPIILIGSATTRIGDPSGKDQTRQLLDEETIQANKAGIARVFSRFLELEEPYDPTSTRACLIDNKEWLEDLRYLDVLRDVGRHVSVAKMLSMESVRRRLEREQHLSFLEFNYMILQAYDFVAVGHRYGCRLQIGGSDQWGNITQGCELYRHLKGEEARRAPLFGLTTPLLTTANGEKMGKTATGAVWLDANLTSPYAYWQFWRNCDDRDVGRFLRLFTELPLETILELEVKEGAGLNAAKKVLATEATTLLHGAPAAMSAQETAEQTFEAGGYANSLPHVTIDIGDIGPTPPAFKLFQLAGLAASGKEAKRLIQAGGARINDAIVRDENQPVDVESLKGGGFLQVSAGRKRHIRLYVRH